MVRLVSALGNQRLSESIQTTPTDALGYTDWLLALTLASVCSGGLLGASAGGGGGCVLSLALVCLLLVLAWVLVDRSID